MARAILHIGIEKTGTQTLQSFLAANRAALAARGFRHAGFGRRGNNHTGLAAYAQDDAVRDDLRIAHGVRSAGDLDAFRKRLEAEAAREIAEHPEAVFLFSNEHLASRLDTASSVARLAELLGRLFERVEVAVYLRRQEDVGTSLYSTLVKFGAHRERILPDPDHVPTRWHYDRLLALWAGAFGREALHPAVYDRASLAGGDITADFAARWGLGEGLAPVADENEGLMPHAAEVLHRLNAAYPAYHGLRPNPMRGELGAWIGRLFPGRGLRPSRAEAAAFQARFDASNEAARAAWFPDRATLFEPDLSRYPETADPRAYRFEDAVDVFRQVWRLARERERALEARLAPPAGPAAPAPAEPPFNARWPAMQAMVLPRLKLLYLPIAKCACTSLKSLAVRLSDLTEAEKADILGEVHGRTDGRRTGLQLKDHDEAAARAFLAAPGWMRVAVVRDPFDRLVSAYLEKFVIRRENKGVTTAPVVAAIQGVAPEEADLARGVRFAEFLEFVLSEPPDRLDPHWCPQILSFAHIDVTDLYAIEHLPRLAADLSAHTGQPVAIGAENRKRVAPSRVVAGAAGLWPEEIDDPSSLRPESFFDAESRARVADAYAADLTLHRAALKAGAEREAPPMRRGALARLFRGAR